MTDRHFHKLMILVLSAAVFISGCGSPKKVEADLQMAKPDPKIFETTLGNLATIYQTGAFNVEAYGLVVNLQGTGSSECEPFVRAKLVKHIQKQLKTKTSKDADNLINSMDTAVVYIRGVIPALAMKGETFDLQVFPLTGTQTTSLEGGRLYTVDLTQNANVNYATTIAYANGPIFVNKVAGGTGTKSGYYILGGGKVIDDAPLSLWLKEPNYFTSNAIRNRINERFGPNTANAVSSEEINISFPKKYKRDKFKFLAMVDQLYLGTDSMLTQHRVNQLAKNLEKESNKLPAEFALEAIGNTCVKTIKPLLDSEDKAVRFHTARCLMNLADESGLKVIKDIAYTNASEYRISAIEALGSLDSNNEAVKTLNDLLSDPDRQVVLTAYKHLRDKKAFAITQKLIAGDFIVENVISNGAKTVYASRESVPKIVLFGYPINCNPDIFVKSDDGSVVITAEAGKDLVSLMKKHPTRPTLIGPLPSTYLVDSVIRTLGEISENNEEMHIRAGLDVPYSEILSLLEKMCQTHMIDAEFVAGPMTSVTPLKKAATKQSEKKKD